MGLFEGREVSEVCAHSPGFEVHHSVINHISTEAVTAVMLNLPQCLGRIGESPGYIITLRTGSFKLF